MNKFWNRLKIQPILGIQRFSGFENLKSMLQTQKILEVKQETQGVKDEGPAICRIRCRLSSKSCLKLCPGEPTDSSVGWLQFTDLEHVPPAAKGCLLKKSTVTNSV